MIKLRSKRGYEFSFTWIFTIFVGAMIIFFAIYFAIQIVDTQRASRDTTEGKSLGILLTPVETEIEEGKFATIYLTDPTRIYFECEPPSSSNPFGSQLLKLSIKPALGQKWEDSDSPQVTFHNKYFFPSANATENEHVFMAEGEEKFYVLSKPLYLPFKVADLMIIYSDKERFCFQNINSAQTDFKSEIQRINMTNVFFGNCDSTKQKIICFSGASGISGVCDIAVIDSQKKVIKDGEPEPLFYLESSNNDKYALLYAAIFSNSDTYQCQVRRLMAHASKLSDLYYSKSRHIANFLRSNGCSSNAQPILLSFNNTVSSAAETGDLSNVMVSAGSLHSQNSFGGFCALF